MFGNSWVKLNRRSFSLLGLLIVATLPLASSAQTQSPIFPLAVPSSTTVVAGMVTGDFNGDGQSDTAYISGATITVLLNQGSNNSPTPVVTSGLACTPQSPLVAADMDKDNNLDLVLTCKEGEVVILLGNGDGTFRTPSYYAVANVNSIASPVDLNGDGFPDIVVATASSQPNGPPKLGVLLNQGSEAPGTLSSLASYTPMPGVPAGTSFSSIAVGDFNGDGKQDIFGATESVLEVFYGNGDGTLQTGQPVAALQGSATVFATLDLNQDGITDVAYINGQPSSTSPEGLQVLLGNSNGGFAAQLFVPLVTSQIYQSVVPFHSTNSSGIVNLALIGSTSSTIALGDGSGNYTIGQTYGVAGNPVVTQVAANGDTNLLFAEANQTVLVTGNGDGTFQAPPTTFLGAGTTGPFVTADLDGNGLTDVLSINNGNLVAALSRGNGMFAVSSQLPIDGGTVTAGDFNGDGNIDAAVVASSHIDVYSGNGDGTFQYLASGASLGVEGLQTPLAGDFNGDGKLDLIVPYTNTQSSGSLFLAGLGDGTFAAPVSLSLPAASIGIAADVNHDGKLDLVGDNSVSLGNADGTFQTASLGIPGTLFAIGDLNGDTNPDLVIGNSVYAGDGQGNFAPSPLYTAALPQNATVTSASIGDVNQDGNPDFVLQYTTASSNLSALAVFLGNGHGSFTPDPNTYSTGVAATAALARVNNQAVSLPGDGTLDYIYGNSGAVTSLLNQLNSASTTPSLLRTKTSLGGSFSNIAPTETAYFTALVTGPIQPIGSVSFTANGTALGTFPLINGYANLVTSFPVSGTYTLVATYSGDSNNQPSSSTESVSVGPLASTTTFGLSDFTPGANTPLTFSVSVSGSSPSGTVTFSVTGGATLGAVTLVNGSATLSYIFPAVGTYPITATYSGDAENLPSSATGVVTVVPADFLFTSGGNTATLIAGQRASTILTIKPQHGYNETVIFSCGKLAPGETCSFTPATVTPLANGQPVSSSFVFATTARTSAQTSAQASARLRRIAGPVQGVALAGLLCLTLAPWRLQRLRTRFLRTGLFTLLLAVCLFPVSGCSSASPSQSSATSGGGTPAETQTLVITASDVSGAPSHSVSIQLTIE